MLATMLFSPLKEEDGSFPLFSFTAEYDSRCKIQNTVFGKWEPLNRIQILLRSGGPQFCQQNWRNARYFWVFIVACNSEGVDRILLRCYHKTSSVPTSVWTRIINISLYKTVALLTKTIIITTEIKQFGGEAFLNWLRDTLAMKFYSV